MKNLRDIRTKRNLTQQAVADYLGCSSVVYSRYETEKREPSLDTILKMADLFDVTVDYLLGRREVEDSTLSNYELKLVLASRNADERARNDALNVLLNHSDK